MTDLQQPKNSLASQPSPGEVGNKNALNENPWPEKPENICHSFMIDSLPKGTVFAPDFNSGIERGRANSYLDLSNAIKKLDTLLIKIEKEDSEVLTAAECSQCARLLARVKTWIVDESKNPKLSEKSRDEFKLLVEDIDRSIGELKSPQGFSIIRGLNDTPEEHATRGLGMLYNNLRFLRALTQV